MPEFTPGPWFYDANEPAITNGQLRDEYGECTDAVCIIDLLGAVGGTIGDVHLIAAAPDLYEALAELRGQVLAIEAEGCIKALSNERRNMLSAWLLSADKALLKARGEK